MTTETCVFKIKKCLKQHFHLIHGDVNPPKANVKSKSQANTLMIKGLRNKSIKAYLFILFGDIY